MKKRFCLLLCSICIIVSIVSAGCGSFGQSDVSRTTEYVETAPAGETSQGELAPAVPGVCIDRMGYEPEKEKIVVFQGTDLPDTFTLREAQSGQIVYTGTIEKKGNEESEAEYNGYGDFSDYRNPGSYYIQIDRYGESYPFLIHDNLYYSLFLRGCTRLYDMQGNGRNGTGSGWQSGTDKESMLTESCQSMFQLLLSYEMFPEVYTDDIGIPESGNGIPDILDLCRYEAVRLMEQTKNGNINGIQWGYLAAVLAKYAYLTRNDDEELAGECLQAAEEAWKCAEKDLFVSDDLIALAAAELYRMTGSRQYLGLAEEYLRAGTERETSLTDLEFFGSITYMNTKNPVDIELCDAMMKKIMEEAEAIAERAGQNSFLIYGEPGEVETSTLLQQTLRICLVNHIITNHEYSTVIENHFHYLLGRNPGSICYVSYRQEQELQEEDVMEDAVQISALLFLLSERLANGA